MLLEDLLVVGLGQFEGDDFRVGNDGRTARQLLKLIGDSGLTHNSV